VTSAAQGVAFLDRVGIALLPFIALQILAVAMLITFPGIAGR